jgi:uncharacterized membrane protein YhaH (DUF805 family)
VVHLLLLGITRESVVFTIFTFSLISFFFIIILVVIIIVIVPWQLLSFLGVFSHRYHDHDLKGILLLRNVLRRLG